MANLQQVIEEGHTSIELRKDGFMFIYFCLPCLARCCSFHNLRAHLNGKKHRKMIAPANLTLDKPNPWPFRDGRIFFHFHAPLPLNDQEPSKKNKKRTLLKNLWFQVS